MMGRWLEIKGGIHMGLLDGILGNVVGSMLGGNRQAKDPLGSILSGLAGGNAGAGGSNPLLQIVLSLLQQNGGLEEVLGKFLQGGLGAQADSWVSTGPNMGISPAQLEQIFGSSALGGIASQLGAAQEQAGSTAADVLPGLAD